MQKRFNPMSGTIAQKVFRYKYFTISVASRRNFETTFSAEGVVCFPQYQQNFIDL